MVSVSAVQHTLGRVSNALGAAAPPRPLTYPPVGGLGAGHPIPERLP